MLGARISVRVGVRARVMVRVRIRLQLTPTVAALEESRKCRSHQYCYKELQHWLTTSKSLP